MRKGPEELMFTSPFAVRYTDTGISETVYPESAQIIWAKKF